MTNIAHASITGAELHEPKGIASAAANTVYVANGSGSGAWTSGGVLLTLTGMVADFALPIAPSGWLECDGGVVSRSTYADLFSALTIQQSATRIATSTTVVVANASHMKAGYFVEGTGIPVGTTIANVIDAAHIVLSVAATSSGTSAIIVSPYALPNSTTFALPNGLKRYRRGRDISSGTQIGALQADVLASHLHTATTTGTATAAGSHAHTAIIGGITGGASVDHTHTGTSGTESATHTHTATVTDLGHTHTAGSLINAVTSTNTNIAGGANPTITAANSGGGGVSGTNTTPIVTVSNANASATHTHTVTTGGFSSDHSHTFVVTPTISTQADHTHTLSASTTVNATGSSETRPLTLVVLTCIKT